MFPKKQKYIFFFSYIVSDGKGAFIRYCTKWRTETIFRKCLHHQLEIILRKAMLYLVGEIYFNFFKKKP